MVREESRQATSRRARFHGHVRKYAAAAFVSAMFGVLAFVFGDAIQGLAVLPAAFGSFLLGASFSNREVLA